MMADAVDEVTVKLDDYDISNWESGKLEIIMMADAVDEVTVKLDDYDISNWESEDSEYQENSAEVNSDGPPIRKLFIRNINAKIPYKRLSKFFKYYGEVVNVHIARDKFSHSKKNYGFVTFKNPQDAQRVLKLKREELLLDGRYMIVSPANDSHQPIELPDGSIIWNSKQKSSAEEYQSSNGVATLSEKLPATDKEDLGAVGGSPNASEEEEKIDLVDCGECKINILNDDCLLHIFSFLPKTEAIRIERVCKRWQSICRDMWVAQKHLDFFFLPPHYLLNMTIFEEVLKRCGKNLQSLDLSHKNEHLTAKVHQIIAKYCRNLRCLNLRRLPLTQIGLKNLGTISKELRVLNLNHSYGASDKDLQFFFKKCPNLESVSLSHHSLTGKCFHGLSQAPVSQLILDECNNIRTKHLVSGLRALKQLKDLSLNSCSNLTGSDVTVIMTTVPKLNSLSMTNYFPLLSSTSLLPLSSLHDLVTLNLQFNHAVNDSVIEAITKNCKKLEDINLTGCSIKSGDVGQSLTNRGVKCLATLPNLSHLSISYLAHVTDEALHAIAYNGKLQSLICCGCLKFTDVGCISIVTSCSELERFVVSGCDRVSKATLDAALRSVKIRTNGIKLTLVVGGTDAVDCAIEMHPLLEVDRTNLCISHLRPDFEDDIYFAAIDFDGDDFDDNFDDDFDDNLVDELEMMWNGHHFNDLELIGDDMEYLDDLYID